MLNIHLKLFTLQQYLHFYFIKLESRINTKINKSIRKLLTIYKMCTVRKQMRIDCICLAQMAE